MSRRGFVVGLAVAAAGALALLCRHGFSHFSTSQAPPLHISPLHWLHSFFNSLARKIMDPPRSPVDSKAASDAEDDRSWRMVHLKTKEECRLTNETIQVYAVELPSKHAEGILRVIKENINGQDRIDLQHLRRFAKPKFLPPHVLGQRDMVKEMYAVPRAWENTPHAVIQADTSGVWSWTAPSAAATASPPPPRVGRSTTLYLLICPTNIISIKDLHDLLKKHTPFTSSPESWAYPLEIKAVTVPRLAPTSPAQANQWSEQYWPTFYRKTNPFGAHPAAITKAEEELHKPVDDTLGVGAALELADKVGCDNEARGLGINTGCVIVERTEEGTEIIAIAGDARKKPVTGSNNIVANDGCQGNVMGHAVMRALGFVARKRLRVASQTLKASAAKAESNFDRGGLHHDESARDSFFLDLPITPLEQEHFDKDNIKPDGYLCLKLEIYTTHEPCVMCSMALVHSRVGRVIFKHRMPQTGGLTSELASNDSGPVGLGYGLCWRKELNWQFMCWEYVDVEPQPEKPTGESASAPPNSTASPHITTNSPAKKPRRVIHRTNMDSSFASTHV